MKQVWSDVEFNAYWLLSEDELALLKGKTGLGRVLFSIFLKHYRLTASFPIDITSISYEVADFIANQVGTVFRGFGDTRSLERSIRDYCREIRSFLGIRRFDRDGKTAFREWAVARFFPKAPDAQQIDTDICRWFSEHRFELPSDKVLSRLIGSAEQEFESDLFNHVTSGLSSLQRAGLEHLLDTSEGSSGLSKLRSGTGAASLANVLNTISQLTLLRAINLPEDLLSNLKPALIEKYRLRAGSEDVWELRRHSKSRRLALLSFYCIPREAEIIDGLVDLLIGITHKISARAERKVVTELVGELMKVHGKTNLLFRIAEAANKCPDKTVREVIFPAVGEQTIADLVKEYRSNGPAYVKRIYCRIRSSYARHYRRMLPQILNTLKFCSNNTAWRPLLDAIDFLKNGVSSNVRYFSLEEVPFTGVVQPKWRDSVIEESKSGEKRINRINYEICVLQSLREKLRSKEVWVSGARRFCNPEYDLPQDFEINRRQYYTTLGQPLLASTFASEMKGKMQAALESLNTSLPKDPDVHIRQRGGKARISVSPLTPQEDPPNLNALKLELGRRWPATSLLDVLKETELRVNFTKSFASSASRTMLDQENISRKLLLTLYGLGTNAGLKALSAGPSEVSYKELLHIRRRYIHRDSLRQATQMVVNATLRTRLPEIWGVGTTSCASDSTQFAAWDQNLMTEWHHRYGGRGVMIYWHVDTKATCIHSQLKRCSSSEVAAMIEGVLHHCTELGNLTTVVDANEISLLEWSCPFLNSMAYGTFEPFVSIPPNTRKYCDEFLYGILAKIYVCYVILLFFIV